MKFIKLELKDSGVMLIPISGISSMIYYHNILSIFFNDNGKTGTYKVEENAKEAYEKITKELDLIIIT